MATKTDTAPSEAVTVSAALDTYSDLELLHVLADLGGDMDPVTTNEIAVRLFGEVAELKETRAACNRRVGGRMSWLRKIGLLDRKRLHRSTTWVFTDLGGDLFRKRMAKWRIQAIEELDDEQNLHLAEQVGRRLYSCEEGTFPSMERQIRHHVLRRKKLKPVNSRF